MRQFEYRSNTPSGFRKVLHFFRFKRPTQHFAFAVRKPFFKYSVSAQFVIPYGDGHVSPVSPIIDVNVESGAAFNQMTYRRHRWRD